MIKNTEIESKQIGVETKMGTDWPFIVSLHQDEDSVWVEAWCNGNDRGTLNFNTLEEAREYYETFEQECFDDYVATYGSDDE